MSYDIQMLYNPLRAKQILPVFMNTPWFTSPIDRADNQSEQFDALLLINRGILLSRQPCSYQLVMLSVITAGIL